MNRIRIFWNHPMLMDYRKPLFDLMNEKYDIVFFFNKNNLNIKNDYRYITSNKQLLNKGVTLKDIVVFIRQIRKADIFITSFLLSRFSILGLIISKILNKKTIVWEEINGRDLGLKEIIKRKFAAIISKGVNAFYVLGNVQKDALNLLGVRSDKIFVANEYPGYVYWNNSPDIIDLADRNMILNIGRLIEFKGVNYLINAFQLIQNIYKNIYLNIVGDGELRESLIAESKRLKINNIYFIDHVTDLVAKQNLYNTAKMVIVPSILCKSGREGGPLVILESLSAGTPVIASDCTGSTGKFIKDGINGYITEEKNVNDLASKIDMLMKKIDKKQINRETVKIIFDQIPNHKHQYNILKSAIDYITI